MCSSNSITVTFKSKGFDTKSYDSDIELYDSDIEYPKSDSNEFDNSSFKKSDFITNFVCENWGGGVGGGK